MDIRVGSGRPLPGSPMVNGLTYSEIPRVARDAGCVPSQTDQREGVAALQRSVFVHTVAFHIALIVATLIMQTGALPYLRTMRGALSDIRRLDLLAGATSEEAYDADTQTALAAGCAFQSLAYTMFIALPMLALSSSRLMSPYVGSAPASERHERGGHNAYSAASPPALMRDKRQNISPARCIRHAVAKAYGSTPVALTWRVRTIILLMGSVLTTERAFVALDIAPVLYVPPTLSNAAQNGTLGASTVAMRSALDWRQPTTGVTAMALLATQDCFLAEIILLLIRGMHAKPSRRVIMAMKALIHIGYALVAIARFVPTQVLALVSVVLAFGVSAPVLWWLVHQKQLCASVRIHSQSLSPDLIEDSDCAEQLRQVGKTGYLVGALAVSLHMLLRIGVRAVTDIFLAPIIDNTAYVIKSVILPPILVMAMWAVLQRAKLRRAQRKYAAFQQEQLDRERRLLQYLCHELRSPLNTLALAADELMYIARTGEHGHGAQDSGSRSSDLHPSWPPAAVIAATATSATATATTRTAAAVLAPAELTSRGAASDGSALVEVAAASERAVASIQHSLDNILLLEATRNGSQPEDEFDLLHMLTHTLSAFERLATVQKADARTELAITNVTASAPTSSHARDHRASDRDSPDSAHRRVLEPGGPSSMRVVAPQQQLRHSIAVLASNALRFGARCYHDQPHMQAVADVADADAHVTVGLRAVLIPQATIATSPGTPSMLHTSASKSSSGTSSLSANLSPIYAGSIVVDRPPPAVHGLNLVPSHAHVVLYVQVTDEGQGIARSELPLLFHEFHMIHSSAREKGNSTGLGLAVVRRAITAMRGALGAWSEGVGTGASFWFAVPLRYTTSAAAPPSPASGLFGSGVSMLSTRSKPLASHIATSTDDKVSSGADSGVMARESEPRAVRPSATEGVGTAIDDDGQRRADEGRTILGETTQMSSREQLLPAGSLDITTSSPSGPGRTQNPAGGVGLNTALRNSAELRARPPKARSAIGAGRERGDRRVSGESRITHATTARAVDRSHILMQAGVPLSLVCPPPASKDHALEGGTGVGTSPHSLVHTGGSHSEADRRSTRATSPAMSPSPEGHPLSWITCAMVVDDVTSNRRLLAMLVSRLGARKVLTAEDGADAFRQLEAIAATGHVDMSASSLSVGHTVVHEQRVSREQALHSSPGTHLEARWNVSVALPGEAATVEHHPLGLAQNTCGVGEPPPEDGVRSTCSRPHSHANSGGVREPGIRGPGSRTACGAVHGPGVGAIMSSSAEQLNGAEGAAVRSLLVPSPSAAGVGVGVRLPPITTTATGTVASVASAANASTPSARLRMKTAPGPVVIPSRREIVLTPARLPGRMASPPPSAGHVPDMQASRCPSATFAPPLPSQSSVTQAEMAPHSPSVSMLLPATAGSCTTASGSLSFLHHLVPVVLTDQHMPVCTGDELTRNLRSRGYIGLVIGVTGNAHPADMQRLREAGANIVLLKPVAKEHLVSTLLRPSTEFSSTQ